MVCTLLAGVNVVAFAADGDLVVTVNKFYNDATKGGDGEHLFTKDADEMSWLSSLPTWNNEGEAWKAPVSSSTSVYRCYNPNSGEHLYVDEGYADYLAGEGWNKEKLAFYSDDEMGVPVYRLWNGQDGVGSHHFTTDAGEVDWLVGQGWTKEDVAFYGIKEESAVVQLVDQDGLQSDGTALNTDNLAVIYGSDFGTPKSIVWYCNGATAAVFDGDNINLGLNNTAIKGLNNGKMPTGEWYVQVENTKGQIFKTNPIEVSDVAEDPVIDGFTIADNYEALALATETDPAPLMSVDCAAETDMVVIDFTMNKYQHGTFYVVDADATTVTAADIITTMDNEEENGEIDDFVKVSPKEFDNANLYKKAIKEHKRGIWYAESNGTRHYKFVAEDDLTRGDEYVVVFANDGEDIEGEDLEDLNCTDAYACPYLYAPTGITVTDKKTSVGTAGWTATLDFFGTPAAQVSFAVADGDVMSVALYSNNNDSTDIETAQKMDGDYDFFLAGKTYADMGMQGLEDSTARSTRTEDQYVFATWTGDESIFGEDVELVSEVVEVAEPIASGVTVEAYDPTDPDCITAKISNLEDNSIAFLITHEFVPSTDPMPVDPAEYQAWVIEGIQNTGKAAADELNDNQKFVSMQMVSKGAKSVTFENAISKVNQPEFSLDENPLGGDLYFVVVVPVDQEQYSYVASDNFATVSQVETTYALSGTTTNLVASTGAGVTTNVDMTAKDQFGNKIAGKVNVAAAPCTFVPVKQTSVTMNIGFAVVEGKVAIYTATDDVVANVGDKYTYKLNDGQTVVITCTSAGTRDGNPATQTPQAKWSVQIK